MTEMKAFAVSPDGDPGSASINRCGFEMSALRPLFT